MALENNRWERIYQKFPLEELGWELGKPRPILVEYVERGAINRGKALDICCGAGTNTIYLALQKFEVTGIDISSTAIEYAKAKAIEAGVSIRFMSQDFLQLPFKDEEFDFVFDMGCFHHVEVNDRLTFIKGVSRVLRKKGIYMLTCFSYRNGKAWNYFTKSQLFKLFSPYFEIGEIRDYPSMEGDGVVRYFFTAWMKKI